MNEAELLFTQVLNCHRLDLYLNRQRRIKDKLPWIAAALKRRSLGEPIQYILGKTEFMGLEFKVNKDVFIPRPETEILVETVMRFVSSVMSYVSCVNILDLGTGSGCVAVSLAKLLDNLKIIATDISPQAIEIAKDNAQLNKVDKKIRFMQSDLFSNDELRVRSYNIIVSNPPYVPSAEIKELSPEIRYEPHIALDAGGDGLEFYRQIIKQAPRYLKRGGFLMMEMGFAQKEKIKNLFQKSAKFEIIEIFKDYNHIDRVIVAQKTSSRTRCRVNLAPGARTNLKQVPD